MEYKIGDIISPNEEEYQRYKLHYNTHGLKWRIYKISSDQSYCYTQSLDTGYTSGIYAKYVKDKQSSSADIVLW